MANLNTSQLPKNIPEFNDIGITKPSLVNAAVPGRRIPIVKIDSPLYTGEKKYRAIFPAGMDSNYVDLRNSYITEAYIRQSVDKYAEKLIITAKDISDFIVTKNAVLKRYLTTRLNLISMAQSYPLLMLAADVARRYVRDGVIHLVPAFSPDVVVPGFRIPTENKLAGLFIVEPTHLYPIIDYDNNDKQVGWLYRDIRDRHTVEKIFTMEEVYSFNYCPDGLYGKGQSQLNPALDDIRSLRDTENAVLKLLYRHLNPLIHIETPDVSGLGTNQEEVDLMSAMVNQMAHDGFLVTGPGVKINTVGAESQALRAEGYLKFFKERGLAGLSTSSFLMGEGSRVSDNSASVLSSQVSDRGRFYQLALGNFFTLFIIQQLLSEIGISLLDPKTGKNRVDFVYPDFDVSEKRKNQTHAADLLNKNIISVDEARALAGFEGSLDIENTLQAATMKLSKKYEIKPKGTGSSPKQK